MHGRGGGSTGSSCGSTRRDAACRRRSGSPRWCRSGSSLGHTDGWRSRACGPSSGRLRGRRRGRRSNECGRGPGTWRQRRRRRYLRGKHLDLAQPRVGARDAADDKRQTQDRACWKHDLLASAVRREGTHWDPGPVVEPQGRNEQVVGEARPVVQDDAIEDHRRRPGELEPCTDALPARRPLVTGGAGEASDDTVDGGGCTLMRLIVLTRCTDRCRGCDIEQPCIDSAAAV